MSATNRLKKYLDSKGIAVSKAESDCGLSSSLLSKAFNNKDGVASINSNNLEKILSAYPDLSAEWLLRGTGDMLLTDKVNQEQMFRAFNLPPNSDKIIEIWLQFMECTRGMQEIYKDAQQPHISHMAT